jgi:hypothetical protein
MFWQVSGARLTSGSGLAALLLSLFGISVSASGLILLSLQVTIPVFTLIKKKIFLIYKEIQSGAVAKSYMTNGLLIYGEIFAHFLVY